MKKSAGWIAVGVTAVVMFSHAASAQPGMGEPPQEAFDACSGQSEGAACTVETPRGSLSGSCGSHQGQGRLLCIPEGGRGPAGQGGNQGAQGGNGGAARMNNMSNQRGRMGPPQEAVSACEGQGSGDSCSFTSPRGEVSGSCRNIGETLACAPQGRGPQGM